MHQLSVPWIVKTHKYLAGWIKNPDDILEKIKMLSGAAVISALWVKYLPYMTNSDC